MDDQNRNLILATVLSFIVILGWTFFFAPPAPDPALQETAATGEAAPQAGGGAGTGAGAGAGATALNREAALGKAARLKIETPSLDGSISLRGGRIDDLHLTAYREALDALA